MLKRVTVVVVIFFSLLALPMLPTVIAVYRSVRHGNATGIGLVTGSPAENLFRLIVLLLLALIAFWLSGKLCSA